MSSHVDIGGFIEVSLKVFLSRVYVLRQPGVQDRSDGSRSKQTSLMKKALTTTALIPIAPTVNVGRA
jgi:hypothetical protein